MAVADVNGDGKPDLMVANWRGSDIIRNGVVGVLLGNGDGTFQPAVIYGSGGSGAASVAVADVNGDGKPDLLVVNHPVTTSPASVGVLLGNGDGTFRPAITYGSGGGGSATSVAVADIDGDGKPDLVVTDQSALANAPSQGVVSVLFGNGDGTFRAALESSAGGFLTNSVAVADVNGDGKPDLFVANLCADNGRFCAQTSVGVLLNNVGATPTTTRLIASPNPAVPNQLVTYTAKVKSQSGGTLNGAVTFRDGFAAIATVGLAGNQAVYSTSYATVGKHPITATYSGELHKDEASMSGVETEQILPPNASTTSLTTSGSPSTVGQPVTFKATVTSIYGTIPDGEWVTLFDGTTALSRVALANGVAAYTTSSLAAKFHRIIGIYPGDAKFAASTGVINQVVNKYATTTTLRSSQNPSNSGQAVKFTARVTSTGASAPTGKVRFADGTTGIGSATLSGGVATLTKSTLSVGSHLITAEYLGDSVSDKSVSAVVNQVVK